VDNKRITKWYILQYTGQEVTVLFCGNREKINAIWNAMHKTGCVFGGLAMGTKRAKNHPVNV